MSKKDDKQNDAPRDLVERAYSLKDSAEQQELYSDWAETYDEAMVAGLKYVSPVKCAELLGQFVEDIAAPILDVGCGTGLAGAELSTLGFSNLHGIDLSRDMLAIATQRGIYSRLVAGDLLKPLEFESGFFSGAICTGTFTHAHVGAGCLDEIFRCLRSGGSFAFTVHRDVHEALGFAKKLKELEASGVAEQCYHQMGNYFDGGDETEGHFYVFKRC